MMYKTHLIFAVFLILLFMPYVNHVLIFIPVLLISSLLPDIDSMHSFLGQKKIFRPLQWIVKHRTFFHSYTIAILIALAFAFYIPILALPFFLGYAIHLFTDSITIEGIKPWWPFGKKIEGKIKTGGKVEKGIFYVMIIINIFLLLRLFLY